MKLNFRFVSLSIGLMMMFTSIMPVNAFYEFEIIIPALSAPLYVDVVNGDDSDSGGITDPFQTITAAVEEAKLGGFTNYQILIAEGDYINETLPIQLTDKNISLYGGYYNYFEDRDAFNHQTAIRGSSDITIEITDSSSTLSGFKIYDQTSGISSVITINSIDGNSSTNQVYFINALEIADCTTLGGAISAELEDGDSIHVYNNYIHDIEALGGGIGIVGDPSMSVIYNNFLFNNIGLSTISAENSLIYNNIISKNSGVGLNLRDNSEAYFNTVVNNNTGVNISTGVSGVIFKNNLIAYNVNDAAAINGLAEYDFNAYFDNGSLIHTLELNEVDCDPGLTNINSSSTLDYQLDENSLCIDIGTEIATITLDYFGESRQKDGNEDAVFASDPGAHEDDGDEAAASDIQYVTQTPTVFSPDADGVNDTAFISFVLNITSNLVVTVEDTGGLVKELHNETSLPGSYNIVWDGTNDIGDTVEEGVYTFMISAENNMGSDQESEQVTVNFGSMAEYCAGFVDVAPSHPLCEAITYVKDEGIFEGYPDGTFRPNSVINRVESTKVILEGFNIPLFTDDGTDLGFDDVIIGSWYMDYLRTAKEEGVVQGYPDGTFKPNFQVLRVELLKIFLETSSEDLSSVTLTGAPYPDTPVEAESSWYLVYVQFSKLYDLVDPDSDGNFNPAEGMMRGDVAELFYRFHLEGFI